MSGILIADATLADLPEIAAIYDWEIANGVATFDTEPRPLAAWRTRLEGGYPFLVARDKGVLGFAYAAAFREKPAYHRSVETTVYVARSALGRGLGRSLYEALLPRLTEAGFHTALALVALPNEASVRLHESCGFAHAGTLREVGDKHDRLIDVGIWQRMLTT